ncbi:MAG: GNAT family N-acetyltransferase [Acidimicrobiales bacterium]
MNVRRATIDDAEVIANLGATIQQTHHEERPDWFKPVNKITVAEMYRNRLTDPAVTAFIAEQDDVALGFVMAEVQVRPDTPLGWAQTTLYLEQIGVAPSQRRRGVGHELFNAVRELANQVAARRIVLTTWEFNLEAHRFFESEGFETEMRRMSMPWPSS